MVSQLQTEITELRHRLAQLEEANIYMKDHVRFVNEQSRLILSTVRSNISTSQPIASKTQSAYTLNKTNSSTSVLTVDPDMHIQSSYEEVILLNQHLHEARQSLISKSHELSNATSLILMTKSELEAIIDSLPKGDPTASHLTLVSDRLKS